MKTNYYYLVSSLPELHFPDPFTSPVSKEPNGTTYLELLDYIKENLSHKDLAIARYIFYTADNQNLLNILFPKTESPFFPYGIYTTEEMKYEIKSRDSLPHYMKRFLEHYDKDDPENILIDISDMLYLFFYEEVMQTGSPFLIRWYTFERNLNNVLTAIECRKHDLPIEHRSFRRAKQKRAQAIIGDNDVAHSIISSNSYDFSLTGSLNWLPTVLSWDSSDPLEFKKEITLMKWENLSSLAEAEPFTLEFILGYLAKLQFLWRWDSLDVQTGREKITTFLNTLEREALEYYQNTSQEKTRWN